MAEPLTLDAILDDLQAIEPLILEYEKKYKVLTPYFYKLYHAGKLEENWDFIDWAGLYDIKIHREKAYRALQTHPAGFETPPHSCAQPLL